MNSVNLLGRITIDPELKSTTNGTSVTSFNLAVNGMKNDKGEQRTDFIPITIWNKQAENVCKYVHKGDQLAIGGKIQSNNYEDKEGNKRTRIEVLATNVHFLGTKKQETTQSETQHEEDALEDFDDQVIEDDLELPF